MNKKVVLLTGAAGGIGQATLIELVKNPRYTLCLIDLPASLMKFKKDHPELSKSSFFFPCDLKHKSEIKTVIKAIVAKHESIDILINNAGIMRPNSFLETSETEIEEQIQVNLIGTIYMSKESLPHLINSKGKIVNISSLAGVIPAPFHSIYSATKFAIRSYSLSLGLELKGLGVSVVCVLPGTIQSPMTDSMAKKNSSPMAYLNPPLEPSLVADAILKAIQFDTPEVYVPYSQGLLARIGLFFPSILVRIYPILSRMGTNNLLRWKREGKI